MTQAYPSDIAPVIAAQADDAKSLNGLQRDERRDAILSAAEGCFIQHGFHRTTMQMVAKAVGMSPGNLYRYFPSKNTIVEGLVERDREEARRRFSVRDRNASFWDQIAQLGADYFLNDAHEKAALCIEIWAEASRNPEIDAINRAFEAEIVAQLIDMLDSARARGEIAADIDSAMAAQVILIVTNGLYVRFGLRRGDDAAEQFKCVMQAIYGLLSGAPVLRCQDEASQPNQQEPLR